MSSKTISLREDTYDRLRRARGEGESFRLVPYDAEAAKRAVDFQRQLRRDGEPVGAVDAMVAGTALARDERVVTRNVSEFHRTPARVSPY